MSELFGQSLPFAKQRFRLLEITKADAGVRAERPRDDAWIRGPTEPSPLQAGVDQFGKYLLVGVLAPATAAALGWFDPLKAGSTLHAVEIVAPLAIGALIFLILNLIRRSTRVRVTNRSIETEIGLFSRAIDVVELWRVKDLRYKQSFFDRILGIAHIEIFTRDVTTPNLEIVGLPASRQLFEKLRDSIEIQRQSRRVMGIME